MLKTRTRLAQSTGRRDVTRGNLADDVWRLAWPSILSELLFMTPPLYDALWLGKLSAAAQAAAGLATSARITMASLLMALGSAGGALVARYLGAKKRQEADRAALQAVVLLVLVAGLLSACGYLWAEPLMRLAGADGDLFFPGGALCAYPLCRVGDRMVCAGGPQGWALPPWSVEDESAIKGAIVHEPSGGMR